MDNFEWMKPNEIMKKRKIKSKNDLKNKSVDTHLNEPTSNKNQIKLSVRSFKRKNPFSCTSSSNSQDEGNKQKKIKIDNENNLAENGCQKDDIFKNFQDYCVDEPMEGHTHYNTFIKNLSLQESNQVSSQRLTSELNIKPHTNTRLPPDLSLKGRIRFTLTTPSIDHILQLKSNEEAEALRLHYSQCFRGNNVENNNIAVLFHSHLMYHIFPALPGLNTFPRFNNTKNKIQDIVSFSKEAEQLMYQQWNNSLHSCLQTLRRRHTNLFYVCSSNCTILFTSFSGRGVNKGGSGGGNNGSGGGMGSVGGGSMGSSSGGGDKKFSGSSGDMGNFGNGDVNGAGMGSIDNGGGMGSIDNGGGMGSIDNDIVAIITPSTKGFRKALDKEGIKYTLPLNQKKKRSSTNSTNNSNISTNPVNNSNITTNNSNMTTNTTVTGDDSVIDNDSVNNNSGINNNSNINNSSIDICGLSSSCDSGVGGVVSNTGKSIDDNDVFYNDMSLMGDKEDYGNENKINNNKNNNNLNTTNNKDDELNNNNSKVVSNDEDEEDEEDDEDWLERLGISSINVVEEPSKGNLSSSQPSEDYKRIDYRPESTVLIRDFCEVNALLNFIMNNTTMISVGSCLPPSIISPSPFQSSTLQSLKVSNKGEVTENRTKKCVFEITGPIMSMDTLCRVVSKFSSQFNVSAFSSSNSNAFNVEDSGDNSDELKQNTALKEVFYEKGLYFWKSV